MDGELIETEVREHLLVRCAMKYMKLAGEWFYSAAEDLDEYFCVADLGDHGEAIMYNRALICARIQCAVRHLYKSTAASHPGPAHVGYRSAKVALIGMDRSIAAWWRIRGQFPEHRETIAKCLVHLTQLKEATKRIFVNARCFVQSGFDEGDIPFL